MSSSFVHSVKLARSLALTSTLLLPACGGAGDPVEKREAALAWPGWDSFWTAPDRWPVEAVGAEGYCVRYLSHVKVVCRPDREPEAKVYLAVEWVRSGESRARWDGRGGEADSPSGAQGL